MRIIGGTHKGRRINPPVNLPVRPTTDYAKESLFNILNNYVDFESLDVLDLFSGTGNIAYEFASRACKSLIAIDNNYKCYAFIKETAREFGFTNIRTIKGDVFGFLKNCTATFDLIFADPPYELETIDQIPELIFEKNLLNKAGWLILEHSGKKSFIKHKAFVEKRVYGNVNFSIFRNIP